MNKILNTKEDERGNSWMYPGVGHVYYIAKASGGAGVTPKRMEGVEACEAPV